jgi:outer membrane protein assembly factor BamB
VKATPVESKLNAHHRPWYVCAVACAGLGVLFSAIFLVGLIHFTMVQSRTIERNDAELLTLDQQVQTNSSDPIVLERLRSLDARNRFLMFHRFETTSVCALMLLLSMAVLVMAVKWTYALRPEQPRPVPLLNAAQQLVDRAHLGRMAVTGVTCGFAVLFVVMAVQGQRLLSPAPVTAGGEAEPNAQPASEPGVLAVATEQEFSRNWHRFRGQGGAGVVHVTDIPTAWDGAGGQGIAWKVPVPGPGNNSPIVWGSRIFFSGFEEGRQEVYCFDAADGRLLWTGLVPQNPEAADMDVMEDTGMAASTMATDGHHVYAIFASGDLGCFDFSGKKIWHKALGIPDSSYGYASSLEVYHNRVIVQLDQGGDDDELSRLLAIEGATGKVVHDVVRPVANVWTSPIVTRVGDRDQVIAVSDPWTMGYDANSFEELWRAECVGGDLAASPVVAGGLVFAIEPYSQLVAIKPDGRGNVTDTHIAWVWEEGGPDIASPVSNGQWICLLDTGGEAMFVQTKDGATWKTHEFKGMFQASPSLVGDVLYVLNEDGVMTLAKIGEEITVVGTNALGEKCLATPAFAPGRIYIRGVEHLWCIGE